MEQLRKLPASAGAEWVLGGFGLLRRSPLGLGALGALWGLLASLVVALGLAVPSLAAVLQLPSRLRREPSWSPSNRHVSVRLLPPAF